MASPRIHRWIPSSPSPLTLAFAVWIGLMGGACVDEPSTGEVRAAYLLQNPDGDPLDCAAAGVSGVWIGLYTSREETDPTFETTVDCLTDDAGEGEAVAAYDAGFFDSARVALLDGQGQVVPMATGAPAQWEYLTVELTGGGVTYLAPSVLAVFDATSSD